MTQPEQGNPDEPLTPSEPAVHQLRRDPLPLRGRAALVTGVSRTSPGEVIPAAPRRWSPASGMPWPWPVPACTTWNWTWPVRRPRPNSSRRRPRPSATWTSWSATTPAAAATARSAPWTNTVNPGPVDTGYAPPAAHEAVRRHFPLGRWGRPDDPARLIAWLVTDEAAWITGQVINSEGGFRRWD